jgi:lipoprotein-anchoring transpeptidase ErfK/SrfK
MGSMRLQLLFLVSTIFILVPGRFVLASEIIGPHKLLAMADTAPLFPDFDNDGLTDQQEIDLGTDRTSADSDKDGYPDGNEVYNGFNPLAGNRDRQVKRRVLVNLDTQSLTYYLNDVEVGVVPVSTGLLRWATPNGEFKVQRKVPVIRYTGVNYDYPNTKWNIQFKPKFYLHGAYWHNEFGKKPMSHGCVNIATENAEKLYFFLDVGDVVKVIGKTPLKALASK